uniref:Uncharacterized protein n=1 Tax=Lygus hesperus TaxID=30085 RepID=A0A0A9XZB6_LYGHE
MNANNNANCGDSKTTKMGQAVSNSLIDSRMLDYNDGADANDNDNRNSFGAFVRYQVPAPSLSQGSYLHYIPKSRLNNPNIAREVYMSGFTAYTIERNAMSPLHVNASDAKHVHTIAIATAPPKIYLNSIDNDSVSHACDNKLVAGGLTMRFTGGSLGVLAGFMYYYGDMVLKYFRDSLQVLR